MTAFYVLIAHQAREISKQSSSRSKLSSTECREGSGQTPTGEKLESNDEGIVFKKAPYKQINKVNKKNQSRNKGKGGGRENGCVGFRALVPVPAGLNFSPDHHLADVLPSPGGLDHPVLPIAVARVHRDVVVGGGQAEAEDIPQGALRARSPRAGPTLLLRHTRDRFAS